MAIDPGQKKHAMQVKCSDKKTFSLVSNDQVSGILDYKDSLFLKADIDIPGTGKYQIRPQGIFGTRINVTKNDIETATLKMNWKGQVVISFPYGQEYVLKSKGIFQNIYVLENDMGENLLQFEPKFNWSQFTYSYTIAYEKAPREILLVMLALYAANYFIALMTGTVSGEG